MTVIHVFTRSFAIHVHLPSFVPFSFVYSFDFARHCPWFRDSRSTFSPRARLLRILRHTTVHAFSPRLHWTNAVRSFRSFRVPTGRGWIPSPFAPDLACVLLGGVRSIHAFSFSRFVRWRCQLRLHARCWFAFVPFAFWTFTFNLRYTT